MLLVIVATPAASELRLIEHLIHTYDLDTTWYEVEIQSNGIKKDILADQEITFQALSQKDPVGLFTVRAKVREGDHVVRKGQVRFLIHRYADVLVATDRIDRHRILTESDVTLERKEVTNLRERPLVSFDQLFSSRARRNIRAGAILTTGSVELCPDIEAGREVSVVYSDGLCKITATGRAMQTGMAGDYIRVKNQSSGKIIVARIVDETAVVVDP